MNVFVLVLKQNDAVAKIIKNLGVFNTLSRSMAYLQELQRTNHPNLIGGKFCTQTVEELIDRENDLAFNPKNVVLYENPFYKVVAESTILIM